jgi:hypothetical protein
MVPASQATNSVALLPKRLPLEAESGLIRLSVPLPLRSNFHYMFTQVPTASPASMTVGATFTGWWVDGRGPGLLQLPDTPGTS